MGGAGCVLLCLSVPKGEGWAQCQGPFRTTGHANQVNRGGHMIFRKNKISIHPHPLQFTERVVCFVFFSSLCLLYFKSDRFVGLAELRLSANLRERNLGGGQAVKRGLPSSYRTRKAVDRAPSGNTREMLALLWASVQAPALASGPSLSK